MGYTLWVCFKEERLEEATHRANEIQTNERNQSGKFTVDVFLEEERRERYKETEQDENEDWKKRRKPETNKGESVTFQE